MDKFKNISLVFLMSHYSVVMYLYVIFESSFRVLEHFHMAHMVKLSLESQEKKIRLKDPNLNTLPHKKNKNKNSNSVIQQREN